MTSRGVLIIGPPRSGTSAVTGMLREAGVYCGTRLVPPGDNNPVGHFEDLDFQIVNDRAMGGFYTPRNVVTEVDLVAWHTLVKSREALYPLWCVKDPRFCFVAQYLLPFMSDPRLVICIRDRTAIAKSFSAMTDDMTADEVNILIDKYILALNAFMDGITQSYAHCIVGYDYLVENPSEALEELLDFVLPRQHAIDIIDPELRHHTCDS